MNLVKNSWKIFVRFLISSMMCLVIFMSFIFVFTAAFSDVVGYNIYHYDQEHGKEIIVCEHDAVNKPIDICVCENYDATTLNPIAKTKLSDSRKNIAMLIAQIFSFVTVTGILAGTVWEIGNKDIFKVKHNMISESKLRGLYLGLIAAIPSFAVYVLLILSHLKVLNPEFLTPFQTLNPHFNYIISVIYNGVAVDASLLSATQLILCGVLTLYLPITAMISYYFGYKDINLVEKLTFKKR